MRIMFEKPPTHEIEHPSDWTLDHGAGSSQKCFALPETKHQRTSSLPLRCHQARGLGAWKHDELKALGVEHLIDYRREDFETRTREITAGRGVELVLDAVGGDSFKKGFRLLAPTGRLGMFGVSSAANAKERDLLNVFRTLTSMPWLLFTPLALLNANKGVFDVNLGHMWGEIDRMRGWANELLDLWSKGVIRPKIDRTFRLGEASLAHHYIQDRKNVGKVLLKP